MGKIGWIVFSAFCVLTIATVMVLMLVLVPQVKNTAIQTGQYETIEKQQYTFSGEEIEQLKSQYSVTESDVDKGLATNKYDEGNINPFSPKTEVTIYNEPTLKNESSSGQLTPESK